MITGGLMCYRRELSKISEHQTYRSGDIEAYATCLPPAVVTRSTGPAVQGRPLLSILIEQNT